MDEQPIETTIYSLSEAPPSAAEERRDGERHLTLYRVGSIMIGQRRELCLIKNISGGGMMIRAYCSMDLGTRLTIELKSGSPIQASVSWIRDHNIGVTFDRPIDVVELLSTSMDGPRPRMPRIEINGFVEIRDNGRTHRMRTCDISQGGIKVRSQRLLMTGSDVIVALPDLPAMPSVVRWTEQGTSGITFNRLLPLPQLVDWLQWQRDALHKAG